MFDLSAAFWHTEVAEKQEYNKSSRELLAEKNRKYILTRRFNLTLIKMKMRGKRIFIQPGANKFMIFQGMRGR